MTWNVRLHLSARPLAGAAWLAVSVATGGGAQVAAAPRAAALDNPARREGLGNYLRAMAQLIPPDGATRRLAGYPAYAYGYGNTFVLAIDSNIAEDSVQFAWATSQLAGLDRWRRRTAVRLSRRARPAGIPRGRGPRRRAGATPGAPRNGAGRQSVPLRDRERRR